MSKLKLYWLKGLPASGKSTYAKELVANSNCMIRRVNKDDLRNMIGGNFSKASEKLVVNLQLATIKSMFQQGFSVVCDNTNFNPVHLENVKKMIEAESFAVEIIEMLFDLPIVQCIERDAKRGAASVGKEVIYRMYDQYLRKENPSCQTADKYFIFDIDGTLTISGGRGPYDLTKVKGDKINPPVVEIYKALRNAGYKTIICTGRDGSCEQLTKEWLEEKGLVYEIFLMRPAGDNRKDSIVKEEMFNTIKDKVNVVGVFDDREQVVEMWRTIGLPCFQVDWGMF